MGFECRQILLSQSLGLLPILAQAAKRSFEFAPAGSREWGSASGRPVIELDEAVGIFRIVSQDTSIENGRQLSIANAGVDARPRGRLQMFDEARKLWHEIYRDLQQSGLLGAIVARAEAQVIRLALVYALGECSDNGLIEIVAARQARKRMVASLSILGSLERMIF
jgi:hypothetical protein